MTPPAPDGRRLRRLAAGAVVAVALALPLLTGPALGGLQSRIDNTVNTAKSGTLLYTHSYNSTSCTSVPATITDSIKSVSCPGSPYPATSVGARTDTIRANGTVPATAVTESASLASCGVVQLADDKTATNPLLARYGTTFGGAGPMTGSGSITLDGAATGGYETSTLAQTQPTGPAVIGSATYGLGIWFKVATGVAGPLFGFSDSAANAAGSKDRILYLTSTGQLGFVATTSGAGMVSTTAGFNNNAWHFAYVRIDTSRLIVGLGYTITVFVDGNQVSTGTSGLLGALTSYSGYWHVGWSTVTGIPSYLAGSVSNFVVFNGGNAPTVVSGGTTQTAFDTTTTAATDRWHLNDSGTTVSTASTTTLPVIGSTAPCSYVDVKWGFTTPTSCAVAPTSVTAACSVSTTQLSTAANGVNRTVGTVVPGTDQVGTITLAKDSTYTGTAAAFLPGLIVYAPVSMTFKATASTNWFSTFTWSAAGSGFVL